MGKRYRKMSLNCRQLARNEQMDRRCMFMKIFWVQRVICPCPEAIYMYIIKIFKHLLKNRLTTQSQTLCGASFGRVNESFNKRSWSHDQDGHHGYKLQKHLQIFFRTTRPLILKLGMKRLGIELYKVCINHDPGMTLTYLTLRLT